MASPAVERMKEALFTGMDYMAMPGDYTRGLLGGKPGQRLGGRDMLEAWGLLGANQEGLDVGDVLGFGADLVVDPLNVALGGLGAVAGVGKGLAKGAKVLSGIAKPGKAAESLAAAKSALGAIPGALARNTPAVAYSIGAPVGGAYLMANNEEGSDWKDLVGMGLMASPLALPLAMAAGKPLRKWSKKSVAEAIAAEDANAVQAAGPPTPASYFNEKAIRKAEASGTLTYMHPKDFLDMAYPFSFDEQNPASAATVKKLLESKTPFNTLPELSVQRALQGQSLVTGHEGRHRAQALLDLGVEEMPVVIKMKKGEAPQGKLRSQRVENPPVIDFPQMRQARAVLQPGEHGVLPISRPEIDFLEQLGIRDATKWQEIKRMLGGADARTPEAQAVIQQFLPR